MDERPTHLDLFSGIGMFSYAFERAGFRTVGFAEIGAYQSAVISKHWPSVRNYGDFRNVPRNFVNVVTAGVPCQPASTAGARGGSSDERWLWGDTIDLLGDIRPDYAVLENVSGLLTVDSRRGFNGILGRLHSRGFDAWWTHIPASAVGASHERDRVIIIANPTSNRLQGPRQHIKPIAETENRFREADSFVQSFQGGKLPYVCRRHSGRSRKLDEHRRFALGNTVCPEVAFIFAQAIRQLI